jgi:cytochrome c oxidase subunit 4
MSTTTEAPVTEEHDEMLHDHPSDLQYVKIAALLAFITALEVGTYFIEEATTTLLVGILFPMMIAKFAIVAGYFMHLKYDNPLFKRVFVFGLVLAIVVFTIMLATLEFFSDDSLKFLRP